MKRIEIFEEGFFLTFITEDGKAFAADAPLDRPFSEDKASFTPLPLLTGSVDYPMKLTGFTDTGSQAGRAITLSFCSPSGEITAETEFQFYKGEGILRAATTVTGCSGLVSFEKVFGSEYCDAGKTVCEEKDNGAVCVEYFRLKTNNC